jgi:hypothetical protein
VEFIRARSELGRAIADREIARELLAELDRIDAAGVDHESAHGRPRH